MNDRTLLLAAGAVVLFVVLSRTSAEAAQAAAVEAPPQKKKKKKGIGGFLKKVVKVAKPFVSSYTGGLLDANENASGALSPAMYRGKGTTASQNVAAGGLS